MQLTKLRFYGVWRNMKTRCFNKNYPDYYRYGGRGITVCERWLKYENFEEDMYDEYGYALEDGILTRSSFTLDRIDNNGDYCKENCRWVDMVTQCNNTSRSKGHVNNKYYLWTREYARNYMRRRTIKMRELKLSTTKK